MLRLRLEDFLDMDHPIVVLADLIDWDAIERYHVGLFPSHTVG